MLNGIVKSKQNVSNIKYLLFWSCMHFQYSQILCLYASRMPGPPKFGQQPGMFGQGLYFATDSSKSAQRIYTKGSHKLLLCNLLLGRSKVSKRADPTLNYQKIRQEGFDSVFAPRGTEELGGVRNDEFVVFHPSQALPVYIIHFSTRKGHAVSTDGCTGNNFLKKTLIQKAVFFSFDILQI